jgi:UPF0755 protein
MLSLVITNKRRVLLLLSLFILLIISATFYAIWGRSSVVRSGELVITDGSSAQSVWRQLVAQNYVNGILPLQYYSWRLAADNSLKSGTYNLTAGEHVRDLITRLVAGNTNLDVLTLTFPEGFTLSQIAERVAAQGIGTTDAFLAAAQVASYQQQFSYLAPLASTNSLEGYLFPDTYQFYKDDTPADIIKRLLANFDHKVSDELRAEAISSNRTLNDIIIMASIIEREVISDKDMAMVSGVLWKRLHDGIGLDADATVRYALQKWDAPLTYQDLQTDSPYNTRKWRGLPPGPISNPGLRAIQAAIRPAQSDFYYYLSAPSGETIFSRDLDEHNVNKAKYLR